MGVTCAHEKWVTCAHHGSLAPIGGGSLTPIGGTEDIHTFTVTHGDMGDTGTWPTEITLPEEIHTFRVRHGRDMGFRDMGDMATCVYVTYESEISLDSSEVSQLSCLLFSTVRYGLDGHKRSGFDGHKRPVFDRHKRPPARVQQVPKYESLVVLKVERRCQDMSAYHIK